MEVPYHPLKTEIDEYLQQFIGKELVIKANLGQDESTIDGNDAIGNILEEVIGNLLAKKFDDLAAGESNQPPDIFDERNDWHIEIKVFKSSNGPGFDVYDIPKFFGSKEKDDWLSRAIHKTDYLIFEYEIADEKRTLKSLSHKKLHEIIGYDQTHPITVQYSKKAYKKIRPSSASTWGDRSKTPEKFIKYFKEFVRILPTDLTGRKRKLKNRIDLLFNNLKEELSREE
jgi:hypothetical protein